MSGRHGEDWARIANEHMAEASRLRTEVDRLTRGIHALRDLAPRDVHAAMQEARHDSYDYRQARAALGLIRTVVARALAASAPGEGTEGAKRPAGMEPKSESLDPTRGTP